MFKTYPEAIKYLHDHIPPKEKVFPGGIGLLRAKLLLKKLGDPQNKLKIIHIAGTSGKGSTAFFTSVILKSQGFNVGLSVSPHLLDIRERIQINGEIISKKGFLKYLNEIAPAINEVSKGEYGESSYFEILTALAFYAFYKKGLDYAVMETGLGGTLDATNTATNPNKISVITQIGLDHTEILGKTIDKIAAQKAGIIQPGNTVVTSSQSKEALNVIKEVCLEKNSKLFKIDKNNFKNVSLVPNPKFDFSFNGINIKNIELAALGSFQIENCSLALAATSILSKRDKFSINQDKIKSVLKTAVFFGRMQKFSIDGQTLIVDGAHNPQKMEMFSKNLVSYFPNQKFNFLIGIKKGKDYKNMLSPIVSIAKSIVITSFKFSEEGNVISKIFDSLNFRDYSICTDNKEALKMLLKDKKTVGVVTGSLYLVGEIYPLLNFSGANTPELR